MYCLLEPIHSSLAILLLPRYGANHQAKRPEEELALVMSGDGSANASSVGDSSGSSAGDAVFTSAPMTTTINSGDSCMWYAGGACQQPRTCQDCLNVAIPGDNCAIGGFGQCTNTYMVKEGDSMNYPAANFTYCPSSDATCSSCREEWLQGYSTGDVSLAERCVGTDGCICVAACELPNRDSMLVWNLCPTFSGTSPSQMGMAVGMTLGSFMVFLIFAICAFKFVKRRASRLSEQQQAAQEARREVRRPAASAHLSQLNLTGWTDMRQKLVETEHGRMQEGAKPTLSSTTTPAVIVEESGEGYRPLSPSDRQSRRHDL